MDYIIIIVIIIIIIIISRRCLWCCHHDKVTARVHPVHLMNVGQRQAAADPQTKPTDLGCRLTHIYIHHRHLLLLSPKADTVSDTDFTVSRRVEG